MNSLHSGIVCPTIVQMQKYGNFRVSEIRKSENTMYKAFMRWTAKRRCAQALNRLSDRELKDIGITRRDIPRVAYQAAADWY